MKIDVNSIRVGHVLEYNGKLWAVLKTMHTQPGKGGAYMQVEMKDIQAGTKNNVRFRSSETVEKVHLEQSDFQFLYQEGDKLAFMDKSTYEQVLVDADLLGENKPFLKDGMDVRIEMYGTLPIAVVLPETVILTVSECEPVVKGQTAASSYKPAILDNGIRIMVPPFINIDDKIIVRVENKEYLERAK